MKQTLKNFRVTGNFWPKREFDPDNPADLDEYRFFLQKQKWRNGCPFVCEWPFTSITHMIEHKFTRRHLAEAIKQRSKKVTS